MDATKGPRPYPSDAPQAAPRGVNARMAWASQWKTRGAGRTGPVQSDPPMIRPPSAEAMTRVPPSWACISVNCTVSTDGGTPPSVGGGVPRISAVVTRITLEPFGICGRAGLGLSGFRSRMRDPSAWTMAGAYGSTFGLCSFHMSHAPAAKESRTAITWNHQGMGSLIAGPGSAWAGSPPSVPPRGLGGWFRVLRGHAWPPPPRGSPVGQPSGPESMGPVRPRSAHP